jgi:hypothetical protein
VTQVERVFIVNHTTLTTIEQENKHRRLIPQGNLSCMSMTPPPNASPQLRNVSQMSVIAMYHKYRTWPQSFRGKTIEGLNILSPIRICVGLPISSSRAMQRDLTIQTYVSEKPQSSKDPRGVFSLHGACRRREFQTPSRAAGARASICWASRHSGA